MFLFGVKMIWEAWRMDSDEAEETRREVEHELGVADDTRWEVVYTYLFTTDIFEG